MRIAVVAIGRLGRAPEAALAEDYARRATASGRALGLGPVEIIEVDSRKPGKPAEAEALLSVLAAGDEVIACDEHGETFASRGFAELVGRIRDSGVRRLVFLIGGADGLGEAALARAGRKLAFGPQTWPHALARAMLAEQVYRAVTILGGGPYHRD